MTLSELEAVLSQALPGKVVYHHWPEKQAPNLPYICYYATGSDNFGADNIVYHSGTPVRIELYERNKDLTTEGTVETALKNAEIYWERDDSYIDSEKCYMIIYEVTLNG